MNAVAKAEPQDLAPVTDMGGGILALIERAVRDPSVDIDKMERLLAMQERVTAEDARRAFNNAFKNAKAEMKAVIRNKYNEQTKSSYADLDAVSAAIDPVIEAHGFAMTYGTGKADLDGHYRVTCDLLHEGGHERSYSAEVPADMAGIKGNQNKTATHGFGSTMSYGRRYLKLMVWDISTRDDDGNSATSYDLVSEKQAQEMRDLLGVKGKSETSFINYVSSQARYPIEKLEDIRAADFGNAMSVLRSA